jgi:hypothetical protein
MLLYIFSTITSVIFAYLYQISNKFRINNKPSRIVKTIGLVSFVTSFLTLFILSGFRYYVGVDYTSYTKWFYTILENKPSYFEPGFTKMIQTIQIYSYNPQTLFVAASLIALGGMYISIKKYSINPALSVYLFCTMGFLSHSLNLTRQFIAIGIVMLAFGFLVERKFFKFIIIIIIAALFHKTALILLPLYFLLNVKVKPKLFILLIACSLALSLLSRSIVNILLAHFYPQYQNNSLVNTALVSKYYVLMSFSLVILCIYLISQKKLSINKTNDRIMVNIVLFVAIAHTIFIWLPLANRLSLYIDILLIIVIPQLLHLIPNKMHRYIITVVFVVYFALTFWVSLLHNSNNILPYDNVLFTGTHNHIVQGAY